MNSASLGMHGPPLHGSHGPHGRPRRWLPLLVIAVMGFFAGALFAPDCLNFQGLHHVDSSKPREVSPRSTPLPADEQSVVELFDRASKSVAFIAASHLRDQIAVPGLNVSLNLAPDAIEKLRQSWQVKPGELVLPSPTTGKSIKLENDALESAFAWDSGSGIVWDDAGHIVTNYHVVEGHFDLMVRLQDLTDWSAHIIGFDEDKDLAVLKIEAPASHLSPILVGESRDLRVGQRVFSIGNPFGLSSTLTGGLVSALGRTIRSGTGSRNIIQDVIQTDAAINFGNSGGPLLDSAGRLIGVTTAIVAENGGNAGIGFAIPVDVVNKIVPDLITRGRPEKAGLGIKVQSELNNRIDGVMVGYVVPNSPAQVAGLRGSMEPESLIYHGKGDVIVAIDGERIHNFDDLYRILDSHQPGDGVVIEYVRDAGTLSAKITLQSLEDIRKNERSAPPSTERNRG